MKIKTIAAIIAIALGLASLPGPRASAQAPFQKGVSYAAWWDGEYADPRADLSLEQLATTGAGWISLIVTAYQDTYTSTSIDYTSPHTPTDADLIHAIEHAHSLGLNVMLKPHLDLRSDEEHWRGDIGLGFTTQAQWSAWFSAYRGFIEHYANVAQAHGVEQFCLGTELGTAATQRPADWRAVVAGVRAVFDGPLVYAALSNGEETGVTWWDAVDYIGVDAYYPLNDDLSIHPTVEQLEAGWQDPKALMAGLSAAWNKPILITELGYRSHHGCSCHPWNSWDVSPLDLEEQANAYEAAFRQLNGQPWLAGLYWWQWHADLYTSGPCDDGFSPHDKPAEGVLRAWYGGTPLPPQPLLLPDYGQTVDVYYTDALGPGWQDWSWERSGTLAATDRAHSDAQAIWLTLGPWGALSLQHAAFSPEPYQWLEFYVQGSSAGEPVLDVFFDAADGTPLPSAPVNDCRFVQCGTIDAGTWKRVRIPLSALNPDGRYLTRLSIQNASGQDSPPFWIDDIRLVGAKAPTAWAFLPLVLARLE